MTLVYHLVFDHGSLFCDINVVSTFCIQIFLDRWDNESYREGDKWHDRLNYHRLRDLEPNIDIPERHIIVERALEVLSNPIGMMLGQISVDKCDQETCVEELGEEDIFGNR